MLRNRTAAFATVVLASLPGCSLIIDTNPDGVIREPKTAGAGGKSSEDPTKGGANQGGATSGGMTGSGGTARTGSSVGGSDAGGASSTSGGSTNGGSTSGGSGGSLHQGGATAGGNASGGTNAGGVSGSSSGGSSGMGGTAIPASGAGGTNAATGGVPGTGGSAAGAAGTGGPGGATTGGAANAGGGTGGTTCSSGTLCGTSCVDLATDKNHCGACGHSCRYATSSCIAGKCQPVVLATGQPLGREFGGVAQDANYLYWIIDPLGKAAVMRTAKDGSVPPNAPQFLADAGPYSTHIVRVGDILQWNYHNIDQGYPSGFTYMNVNPVGAPANLALCNDFCYVIAATASPTRVFYIFEPGMGSLSSIRSAVPASANLTTAHCGTSAACTVQTSYSIAVDATNAYWTDENKSLWKVPLAGGTAVRLASWTVENFGSGSLAVYGDNVYCLVESTLMQVAIDGQSSPVPIATNVGSSGISIVPISADASGVYWTGRDNAVWHQRTGTNTPVAIATDQGGPCNVVVDDTTIFWTNTSTGTVMAVVK